MTTPNILSNTTVNGDYQSQAVTASATTIVSNALASGKLYKVVHLNIAITIGLGYFQPRDCTSWDVSTTAAALKAYSFAANNPLKAIAQTGSTFTAGLDDVSPLWGTHSGHIATGGCTGYQATAGA